MRILHLDTGREMRGGQWQVLRLIDGLAAQGVESTLLARPSSPLFAAVRRLSLRAEPLNLARAVWWARRNDLVHAHDARGHTLGAIIPDSPLVVSRRVAFAIGSPLKYDRAGRYLAVSEFVKSVLMAGGVPGAKIAVVYDGVPPMEAARGTRVIAPGNLDDPEKGARLAMEGARLAGVELEFAADLQHDLAQAAMLVYITHSEGLGSAALLAMAAGVPVVASRVGGLPEIVRHRETGLLVENQPEEIAAAIRELTADSGLARRLGQAGRRMVTERFTVDQMVGRTLEAYRTVLL